MMKIVSQLFKIRYLLVLLSVAVVLCATMGMAHAQGAVPAHPTPVRGTVSEFPIPTPSSGPIDIIKGPDRALWFTESNSNKIGRITPSGVISEFPIPTPSAESVDIAQGPDGALWFTEFTGNKIGRITPSGVVREFPVPTLLSKPSDITQGPDGALWFTEYNSDKIGRIATTGAITEFPVPPPISAEFPQSIEGITQGPDGALWFTQSNSHKIGRITTAGVITEFSLPSPSAEPISITQGARPEPLVHRFQQQCDWTYYVWKVVNHAKPVTGSHITGFASKYSFPFSAAV